MENDLLGGGGGLGACGLAAMAIASAVASLVTKESNNDGGEERK